MACIYAPRRQSKIACYRRYLFDLGVGEPTLVKLASSGAMLSWPFGRELGPFGAAAVTVALARARAQGLYPFVPEQLSLRAGRTGGTGHKRAAEALARARLYPNQKAAGLSQAGCAKQRRRPSSRPAAALDMCFGRAPSPNAHDRSADPRAEPRLHQRLARQLI